MARVFERNFLVNTSLWNLGGSVKKSKSRVSVVCGRKSQPSKFEKVKAYTNDFESCFKIVKAIDENEDICEGCRRAVEEHRRTGESFYHVSVISSYC